MDNPTRDRIKELEKLRDSVIKGKRLPSEQRLEIVHQIYDLLMISWVTNVLLHKTEKSGAITIQLERTHHEIDWLTPQTEKPADADKKFLGWIVPEVEYQPNA